MSVGHCYLIEALLQFFKMDNVNKSPQENSPCPSKDLTDDNKARILAVLSKFVDDSCFKLQPTVMRKCQLTMMKMVMYQMVYLITP